MGRLSAAGEIRSLGWLGRCTRCWVGRGRRPAAGRGSAPAGGLVQRGCTPPFSFPSCGKENGPCTVQKKRPLLVATLHIRAKLLYGSRRISACSDLGWPSGTLGSSAGSMLPSRGGWCPDRRGAKPHLTSFSFRAVRFATRCPGGRRSGSLAYAAIFINDRPAAAKRGAKGIPDLPGPKVSPRAGRFRP